MLYNHKNPPRQAPILSSSLTYMHRWKLSALALAAALSLGLHANDARALALGRIQVQSALGEPLRAEIALPQITAAEADSLQVAPASAAQFRSQGLEYTPIAHDVRIELQRRPNGTAVLRLSTNTPVNEPFVDLVIDANWSAGHLVRSYTMLFDPPSMQAPAASVTAQAQTTAPAPVAQAAPRAAQRPAPAPRPVSTPPRPEPVAAPRPQPTPAVAPTPVSAEPAAVTVRTGDTAGRIAQAHRPANVSLDQMLVAMLRTNPEAFIQGNVNRLRAGAVLHMPDAGSAQQTTAAEARKIIAAQSRDFNAFRRALAASATKAEVAAAERSAQGSVQTQVQESKAQAPSPDKLTLSQGSVQSGKSEEQLAQNKQADQDAARMAELSKNISELNQLSQDSDASAATTASADAKPDGVAPAATPQVDAPAEGDAAGVAVPAATSASTQAPAAQETAEAETAEPAKPAAKPKARKPAPPPPPEPSLLETLTDDPMVTGGALAILLLLLGYGGYRYSQSRRNREDAHSSLLGESTGSPDSFFGTNGGQHVDTSNSELAGGSSMNYSPSQLDAGGEVDPIAEADVYLAYGRDQQAEEILKEAMRHHPDRVSIPVKLAEIYAKRQDRSALEAMAREVHRLSEGQGQDWSHVAGLGQALDPGNTLYQSALQPLAGGTLPGEDGGASLSSEPNGPATEIDAMARNSVLPDLDLDVDEDRATPSQASDEELSAFAAAAASAALTTPDTLDSRLDSRRDAPVDDASEHTTISVFPEVSLDLPDDLPELPPEATSAFDTARADAATAPAGLELPAEDDDLSFIDSDIAALTGGDATQPMPVAAISEPAALEFDLGDLSLDLNTTPSSLDAQTTPAPVASDALPDDPLATKLALAEEFKAIGDSEGARSLVEEVMAEADGELKARAQRLLAELD